MGKRTTTKQIHNALSNNLLQIIKAECHYKPSSRIDEISTEKFKDSLDFLYESGVFADCIGWHYEDYCNDGSGYIAKCGRIDPSVDVIVTVYMRMNDGVDREDVERTFMIDESEE